MRVSMRRCDARLRFRFEGELRGVVTYRLVWLRPSLLPAAGFLARRRAALTPLENSILDVMVEHFACLGNSGEGVKFCGDDESHAISHSPIFSFALQLASVTRCQMLSEAIVITLSL